MKRLVIGSVPGGEPSVEISRIAGYRANQAQRRLAVKADDIRVGHRYYGCRVAACKRVVPFGEEVTNVRFIACRGSSFPFMRPLPVASCARCAIPATETPTRLVRFPFH
ncbi:hypothetical protein AB6809_35365 [Paraburkholderia sp. RCC_158]